jgi:hypothetical protein
MKKPRSESRQRKKLVSVRMTSEEFAQVSEVAFATALSVSHLLRVLGLGERPKSRLDQRNVLSLLEVNADLGRLGGLLKLWLSNEEKFEALSRDEVRSLFMKIARTQQELHKLAMSF